MSAQQWQQIEELARTMAEGLLARGVPQEVAECNEAAEQETDRWIRLWLHGPPTALPDSLQVLRLLLARCRYATACASGHRLRGDPLPKSSAVLTAEIYLIDLWHHGFRAQWLSGEKGVLPSEN